MGSNKRTFNFKRKQRIEPKYVNNKQNNIDIKYKHKQKSANPRSTITTKSLILIIAKQLRPAVFFAKLLLAMVYHSDQAGLSELHSLSRHLSKHPPM